jgi:hypothetical protein
MSAQNTKSNQPFPALLPGFEWSGTLAQADANPPEFDSHGRWWVRSSAQQKLCPSTGRPLGFRHALMHGSKVVRSGVGADAARSFTAQAEFLNRCAPGGTTQPGAHAISAP